MKSTFESEASRKTNSVRRLAWPAGLLLLGFSVWAAVGCLATQIGNEANGSRGRYDWRDRCRVEVRQLVYMVNYLLTPEDDVGGITAFVGPKAALLPVLDRLTPIWAEDTGAVGIASDALDRP
jgi:hypothetical protein